MIFTMRKTIYLLFAVIAAAVCTACGNSAFSIEGKLTDAGTQNLRIVYQAGDSIVSQWVPAVNGEFKVDGKASDLSVVYLYSAQMQLIAHPFHWGLPWNGWGLPGICRCVSPEPERISEICQNRLY